MIDDEYEERSFIQRHRGLVILGVLLVIGVVVFFAAKALSGSHQSIERDDDMTMVSLPPPPPPPPPQQTPPPMQTPPPEQQQQKMEEQQPVAEEKKEEAPKDKPPDQPAPLGTTITGPGGGADLGLGTGLGGGGGYGEGGGGGSKYGWYASEVQDRIADALRNNSRTRSASMNVIIRIWPDASGHISKVRLQGSTGDAALDAALINDVIPNVQLADPPPADMPLPIVMRVVAQRPE